MIRLTWACVCLAAVITAGAAWGYPTSLNIIPTADVLGEGYSSLQLEADGLPTAVANGSLINLYTEFGRGHNIEAGLDVYDIDRQARWDLNAKWQFVRETHVRPALAVGVLGIARSDVVCTYYAVATKKIDPWKVKLTAGLADSSTGQGLFGVERDFGTRFAFMSDWTTGPRGWVTVGLSCPLSEELSVLPYYAWGGSERSDFMGLNLTWNRKPDKQEKTAATAAPAPAAPAP